MSRATGLSLHRQLLLWLLLPQLVLWAAGGLATFKLAARYANEAIDDSLSRATRTLARQVKPLGDGLLIDFPRAAQDVLEADPNDRLLYTVSTPPGQFILGNKRLPAPPAIASPRIGEPYFYDGKLAPLPGQEVDETAGVDSPGALRVRVAALYLRYGSDGAQPQTLLVQVARSSANREALARRILVDTLLPLSGLMLLMTAIVWMGIRAGLAPLVRLRREVEARAPADLTPLQIERAPVELRSLARALNTLLAAVERHVASQKRFIADAAHQLRTPLAGLKSQTELALQAASDPEQRARLGLVQQSAERSAHLVNQLLALARAEPGAAAATDVIDLHPLAMATAAEWVPRALKAGVDLGFDPGSDAPATPLPVAANAVLLREALGNLIDNAIRYAGRGAEVTLRVGQHDQQAWLSITDNGPGLPESELERVFERFVRVSSDGPGCGLGLAIVREIIERHGGRIWLEPASPHGLCVRVALPLHPARPSSGTP